MSIIISLIIISVGGIFYGWPAYVFVLKEERIFYDLCENSTHNFYINETIGTGDVPSCPEQDTYYNMLFVIGCALSNSSGLLFG